MRKLCDFSYTAGVEPAYHPAALVKPNESFDRTRALGIGRWFRFRTGRGAVNSGVRPTNRYA